MARRESYYSPECAHEGCTEHTNYVFSTRAEEHAQMEALRRRGGWLCTRHRKPDEVLSVETPVRTQTLVLSRSTKHDLPNHLFWIPEGETGGSGITYGPGFRAFAKDFPEGTRLTITAQIEPPAEPPAEGE